jgi:aspartate aminotransferase
VTFQEKDVVMTVGAGGGLNCVFKAILDPDDEVLVLAPCFMEYRFYVENHGGKLVTVETDSSFRPVHENIRKAVTDKTRAIIVNTPNNPSGAVYTEKELKTIGECLEEASARTGRPVFLISDEPYRKITFRGLIAPSIFKAYHCSLVVTSFSKDLSIAGERLGYVAANPAMEESDDLLAALVLANRILGSVNAPSLMQRVVKGLLKESADLSVYERRSKLLTEALQKAGYTLVKPEGTFYLFPRSPIPDDLKFTDILRDELILAVPGRGFGRSGHFRLSLCLDEALIQDSIPGFARALARAKEY